MPGGRARRRAALAGVVLAWALAAAAAAGGGSQAAPSVVGTWQRTTTCAELVSGLRKAGLGSMVLEMVAGNGFVPGVATPDEITDPSRPCKGAVSRKHAHFFTKDGRFGSLDWRGEQVDDGTYRVLDANRLVVFKEFPKVTFRYRISGQTIALEPLIPRECRTFRCAWSIAVAYPGKTWRRAG